MWNEVGEARTEEKVEGKKCREEKQASFSPMTEHPLGKNMHYKRKAQSLRGSSLALGVLSRGRVPSLRMARRSAGPTPTFTVVVGLGNLQKPEDAGHATQAGVGEGLLQTEDRALEQIQHALVHLPADLLQRQPRAESGHCSLQRGVPTPSPRATPGPRP